MKFLIDENPSEVLVDALSDIAPGSIHVRTAVLGGASDVRLWEAARAGDFTILTRDEDFIRLSIARGHPPKIVHVQLGRRIRAGGNRRDEIGRASCRERVCMLV